MYKSFKGMQWKALTLLTAFLYPGVTFLIFFVLNFFIWGQVTPTNPNPNPNQAPPQA